MHASLISEDFDSLPELLVDVIHERVPVVAIQHPHAADMTRKMSFHNKIGEHFLIKGGGTEVHGSPHQQEAVDEIGRQYEIAQPQRWKQHLAERPDVDYASIGVEPLQGRDR